MTSPSLDDLARTAMAIMDGEPYRLTYIDPDGGVKRRVACGAASGRATHDEMECLADTLLRSDNDWHRRIGTALTGHVAKED